MMVTKTTEVLFYTPKWSTLRSKSKEVCFNKVCRFNWNAVYCLVCLLDWGNSPPVSTFTFWTVLTWWWYTKSRIAMRPGSVLNYSLVTGSVNSCPWFVCHGTVEPLQSLQWQRWMVLVVMVSCLGNLLFAYKWDIIPLLSVGSHW